MKVLRSGGARGGFGCRARTLPAGSRLVAAMASMLTYPKPIVLEPRTAPSASVIFLHGLGERGLMATLCVPHSHAPIHFGHA